VPGNHDVKLLRKLRGKNVKLTHGLAETMAQLDGEPPEFIEQVIAFLDGLISHAILDEGKLVCTSAYSGSSRSKASRSIRGCEVPI
jgi:protein phosphatase